jgi:hypothetical protein
MGDDNEPRKLARSASDPTRRQAKKAGPNWRSLSGIPTVLDRLYLELGGPAPHRESIDRRTFAMYCGQFGWAKVGPELCLLHVDRDNARRHWPLAAFALGQYQYERGEHRRHRNQPNPEEVIDLLNDISRSAKELARDLGRLGEYSNYVSDATAPLRIPHLAYLDQFISQAAAGEVAAEVNQNAPHHAFLGKLSFMKRLIEVQAAAAEAAKRVDKKLLKRGRGQADPGLHNLVRRCVEIWQGMTGRKASAQKLHSVDGDDPGFVKFVQGLVRLVEGPKPTRKQIEVSLKNAAPPMQIQESEQSGV